MITSGSMAQVHVVHVQKSTMTVERNTAIKANSVPVSGSADIARVGTVSSGDETIGDLIAKAMVIGSEYTGNLRISLIFLLNSSADGRLAHT